MTALKNTSILVLALGILAGSPTVLAKTKDSRAADRILTRVIKTSAFEQRMFYQGMHLALINPDVANDTLAGVKRNGPLARGIRFGKGVENGSIRLSQGQTDFFAGTLEARGANVSGTPLSNRTVSNQYTRGILTGQALTASQVAGSAVNGRIPGTAFVVNNPDTNPLTGGPAGGTITIPDLTDRYPGLTPADTLAGGTNPIDNDRGGVDGQTPGGIPTGGSPTDVNSPAADSPTIPDGLDGRTPPLNPNQGGDPTNVDNDGTPNTTTTQLPDGSTVTTTTMPDGTVVTTHQRPDGSTITTTTLPDGTTTTELTGGPAGGTNTGGPDNDIGNPVPNPPGGGGGGGDDDDNLTGDDDDDDRGPDLNPNPNPSTDSNDDNDDNDGSGGTASNDSGGGNQNDYNQGFQDARRQFEKDRYKASDWARANAGLECAEGLFGAYVSRQSAVAAAETAGRSVGFGEGILGPVAYAAPSVPECYTAFTGEYPKSDWVYGLSAAGRAYRLFNQYKRLQKINEARDKAKQQSQYPPGTVVLDNAGNPVGVVGQDGQIRPVVRQPQVAGTPGGATIPQQVPRTVGGGTGTRVMRPDGTTVATEQPIRIPTVNVPPVGGGGTEPTIPNGADTTVGEPGAPVEQPGTQGEAARVARSVEVLCNEWDFNCMWRSDNVVTVEEYETLTSGFQYNEPKDMFFKSCLDGYPGERPPQWWVDACGSKIADMGDQLADNDGDARIQGATVARDMRQRLGEYVAGALQNYDGPATAEAQREWFQQAAWNDPDGNLHPNLSAVINGELSPEAAFNLGKESGADWNKFGRHIASAIKNAEAQRARADALEERLGRVEAQNAELAQAVQGTQQEIAALRAETAALESAIGDLNAKVQAGELTGEQVAERLGTYEQQLNERMQRLDGLLEKLDGQVGTAGLDGAVVTETGAVLDGDGVTVVPDIEVPPAEVVVPEAGADIEIVPAPESSGPPTIEVP